MSVRNATRCSESGLCDILKTQNQDGFSKKPRPNPSLQATAGRWDHHFPYENASIAVNARFCQRRLSSFSLDRMSDYTILVAFWLVSALAIAAYLVTRRFLPHSRYLSMF